MEMILRALFISALQVLLYVGLPMWALRRMRWSGWAERLFAALCAGVATAALTGRIFNGSGMPVWGALSIWVAGWVVAGLFLRGRGERAAQRLDIFLVLILFLAWVVRIIHPLETWALGQSDAYSHLGFLMDVLERGRVANQDYPPAFAWVSALPAWLSHIHPYWTARFSGAFFGAGLTLGAYALVAQWRGRIAGLVTAALVAGCPLFFLLQKTGVGSFANQLGLLLVIAAFWAFAARRFAWLALTLAALAVSVPMMLLHVLILLALWILAERRSIRTYFGLFALLLLGGLGILFVSIRLPAARGMVIAALLTGKYSLAANTDASWLEVFRILAADFLSFKRIGYGSWLPNTGAIAVTSVFALALIAGIQRKSLPWRQVGLWGLLTSANAHLGWLQFTDYQREGWSFLLASACFGGLLFDTLWQRHSTRAWHIPLAAILAVSCLAGVAFPPTHNILAGQSESDVVKYLLHLDPKVTVLTRKTSAFPGGQGDVARTLHSRVIHSTTNLISVKGSVYFLRDRPTLSPTLPLAMRVLQPRQMSVMKQFCEGAEEQTQQLEDALTGRPAIVKHISDYLDVWILEAQKK